MSDDFLSTPTKFRSLSGASRILEQLLLGSLTILGSLWALGIHHSLPWAFFNQQYLGLFLALGLASIFVAVKARAKETGDHVPWHDWFFAVAGLLVGLYVNVFYPTLSFRVRCIYLFRWR